MSPETPIEQSDLMLAEAAKLDLVGMRHVHELLLASDEAKAVGILVNAYARVSRCMRQNLGMLARQKADRAKAEREAAREAALNPWKMKTPEQVARETRAEDLQEAVGRVISAAADGDRALHADWVHRFDRELDDWYEADDFLDQPLHAHVLRAARTLGLAQELAERWADLPEPTYFPDPAPEETAATNAYCRDLLAQARAHRAAAGPAGVPPKPPWLNSG